MGYKYLNINEKKYLEVEMHVPNLHFHFEFLRKLVGVIALPHLVAFVTFHCLFIILSTPEGKELPFVTPAAIRLLRLLCLFMLLGIQTGI